MQEGTCATSKKEKMGWSQPNAWPIRITFNVRTLQKRWESWKRTQSLFCQRNDFTTRLIQSAIVYSLAWLGNFTDKRIPRLSYKIAENLHGQVLETIYN